MNGKNFNIPGIKPRILVAPLEWGLGHATRCIPIIKELQKQNCEVLIAAEGATHSLLQQEFPELTFLPLMGYRMKYSREKKSLSWKIISQFPKILVTLYKENRWLAKVVNEYSLDAVISDNRFGMYNRKIRSVYITHQLLVKTGNAFTEKIACRIHNFFISKYDECWVPDVDEGTPDGEPNGLAGVLSHPKKRDEKIKYLGGLSRFERYDAEKKYDLLIIISGPEPQRTIFEELILEQLKTYTGNCLFARGLPEGTGGLSFDNTVIEIRDHLTASALNDAILRSDLVISRCGYTTVMDLVKLQKKLFLFQHPANRSRNILLPI